MASSYNYFFYNSTTLKNSLDKHFLGIVYHIEMLFYWMEKPTILYAIIFSERP